MKTNHAVRLLRILICLAAVTVLVHVLLNYVNVVLFNEQHGFLFELSNRFDLNDENSLPQWYTQALFLGVSLAAFLAAYLAKDKSSRRLWGLIAAVGLIMSIDDVATLHEFVLQSLHNMFFLDRMPSLLTNAWLLLLPFIIGFLIWLGFKTWQTFPRWTTILLLIGGVVFVIGAVIVDSFTNVFVERSFAAQGIMGAIEGGLQMLGTIIFLYAIVDYLENYHGRAINAAIKQLKVTKQ